MTATRTEIVEWLETAKQHKDAFLIIGLDPFDHDNFPIYCQTAQVCTEALTRLIRHGNSYDEVYDMSLPIDTQLAERRSMHLPPKDGEKHV